MSHFPAVVARAVVLIRGGVLPVLVSAVLEGEGLACRRHERVALIVVVGVVRVGGCARPAAAKVLPSLGLPIAEWAARSRSGHGVVPLGLPVTASASHTAASAAIAGVVSPARGGSSGHSQLLEEILHHRRAVNALRKELRVESKGNAGPSEFQVHQADLRLGWAPWALVL